MQLKTRLLVFWLLVCLTASAQVGINPSGNPADASAGLDVNFNNKGFLMPRLTTAEISAISNPAVGLTVFSLTINKPVFFDGRQWRTYDGQAFSDCGYTLHIAHVPGPVAPFARDVIYSTANYIGGEPGKCWITSNLGAANQASSPDDATEASAGWYFQFNHLQGYSHDGSLRTPETWQTNLPATGDWSASNDPCTYELGSVWRLPTQTEWTNVLTAGNWATSWLGPWNSILKLHFAGYLTSEGGNLMERGSAGYYWSSTQTQDGDGYMLNLVENACSLGTADKRSGFPVRCVMCPSPSPVTPEAGIHVASTMQIQWNWTGVGEFDGFKWNTTSDYATATNMTTLTTYTETNLTPGTSYTRYVWAYNDCGYSLPLTMSVSTLTSGCGVLTINHVVGSVAPVSKSVTYGTEINLPGEPGKCWITSNLGADRQALSVSDDSEASAGWYWQFNRMQGYKHDGTTRTPNTTWEWVDENTDWQAANDPCTIELGSGWRIPTSTEWSNVSNSGGWGNKYGAYNSSLKLHAAGKIEYYDGGLHDRGSIGYFWSGSQNYSSWGYYYDIQNYAIGIFGAPKQTGMSLRCISQQ